jgi:hypothetical protein
MKKQVYYSKKRWDKEVAMERTKDASMGHFGIPPNATAEEIYKWQLSYYKKILKNIKP